MGNTSFGQNRMGTCRGRSQGKTERAIMLRKKEMMSRVSMGSSSNMIQPPIQQKVQWPPYIIFLDNKYFISHSLWAIRLLSLMVCDYYLWGCLKGNVYKNKTHINKVGDCKEVIWHAVSANCKENLKKFLVISPRALKHPKEYQKVIPNTWFNMQ